MTLPSNILVLERKNLIKILLFSNFLTMRCALLLSSAPVDKRFRAGFFNHATTQSNTLFQDLEDIYLFKI